MKKREKRRFSLAARFGILFYAAALLLIVALSVTLFSYFHNNVENSLLASYSQTVSAKAQTINDLLTRLDLYMNLVTDGNGAFLDTLLQPAPGLETLHGADRGRTADDGLHGGR